jgi:endoglucanase
MRRFITFITLLLLFSSCTSPTLARIYLTQTPAQPTETPMPPSSTPEPTATPFPLVILNRGINLGNMLEAPNEGDWGLTVQEEYFDLIKEAGFDFVRLPVNWKAHTTRTGYDDGDTGYTIELAFFTRIDEVVGWALKRNLAIIIDFHNYEDLMTNPNLNQFSFLWKQIAEHYQEYPPQVLFELANEPHDQMTAGLWNKYIVDVLKVVRETNPTRDVVIGPVQWNAYDWVTTLDIPDDPHDIVTFHYYEPLSFTHQGAEWVDGSDVWLGATWGENEEHKRILTQHFDLVADWAQRHNVRVLLGEFGAYSKADMESRVRWTEFVRSEAERHGFAWAYWEFGSGFGVDDPDAKVWREDLLRALIP